MKIRAMIAAALFVSLTVARYILPEAVDHIRKSILPVGAEVTDYRAFTIELGRALSGFRGAIYAWEDEEDESENEQRFSLRSAVYVPDVTERSLGIDGFVERFRVNLDSPGIAETFSVPKTDQPEEELPPPLPPSPSPREIKRMAFLEAQAVFANYTIPHMVSYYIYYLPFETVFPSTKGAAITSGFGFRVHPIHGDVRFHYGVDISVVDGDPIYAFASGRVVAAQEFTGYGLTVIIEHAYGFASLYAHCSRILVNYGDWVYAGQLIALVGRSGDVTGPHLHFELTRNDIFLNPQFHFLCYAQR